MSEAYDWYEERQDGLGGRFYKEINYYLTILENDPFLFPIRYIEDLRAVPVNKFPFLIVYWVYERESKVYVTSIFHTSKEPQY